MHPFILKEFNNRWFVVGWKNPGQPILTFALDRISGIRYNLDMTYDKGDFNGDTYYRDTVGVTVLPDNHLHVVHLKLDRRNAPYVLTKPFHHSQRVLERLDDGGVIVSVKVHLNFEFERLILGYGDSIEVLKPRNLRRRVKRKLSNALKLYGGIGIQQENR